MICTGNNCKSILIVDTPNGCYECPLAVETSGNYNACCITGSRIISYDKFTWCPLKPLPEKRDERGTWTMCGYIDDAYSNGWNDCLDEILGGVNNEKSNFIN